MNEHLTETHRFIPFFPAFSCPFFREGLKAFGQGSEISRAAD